MTRLSNGVTPSALFRVLVFLFLATVIADLGLAGPRSSEDGDLNQDEIRKEKTVPVKALYCNPTGNYCVGTFEELIEWIRFWDSGYSDILPTSDVIDLISSTGFCELRGGAKIGIPAELQGADMMIQQITVAMALGKTFRLQWKGDPVENKCQLYYVILYP